MSSLIRTALLVSVSVYALSHAGPALGQALDANDRLVSESLAVNPFLLAEAPAAKGPPLPFHTIEGVGGGAITPNAFLTNPGPKGTVVGLPSFAASFVGLGQKNLLALTVTETFFGRVELGYGADRLELGRLPSDIEKATGVNVGRDDVWLHSFNARVQIIQENSWANWVPAVTFGGQFKYNDGIKSINSRLGGALESIGYKRQTGEDFTLTATKLIPNVLGRPLIIAAGARASSSAQLGFLGFSNHWSVTGEGHVLYLPTDWLAVAYEFRQKENPYKKIGNLVGNEDSWHAFDAAWIINSHATLVAGYGLFGNLANAKANSAWWIQLKYEI